MAHNHVIKNGLKLGFTPIVSTAIDDIVSVDSTGLIKKYTTLPFSKLDPLAVDVVVVTDASGGIITASTISTTELLQLDGITSNIQAQLDSKVGITPITANRAVVSDAGGLMIASPITDVELSRLGGVTSSVQTQINSKQATITGGATTIATSNLTADLALISNGSGKVAVSGVTSTELGYLIGVTGNLQTQLDTKLTAYIPSPSLGDMIIYNSGAWINLPVGTSGQSLIVSGGGVPTWGSPSVNGIPSGGTTNQVLRKIDATNYNTEWHTIVAADITDVSATYNEINKLSGATITTTELNYLAGTTSNIQTQLDLKLSTSLTYNSLFVGNVSNTAGMLAPGTNGQVLMSVAGAPTWQTFTPGTGSVTSINVAGGTTGLSFTGGPVTTTGTITAGGTLIAANGGTGFASYAVGDLLYANTTTTLAKRPVGTNGHVLTLSGGLPVWSAPGSTVFASDITVVLSGGKTLGKYTNGQTIPSTGLNAEQVLNLIAVEYIPPVFTSFVISGQATTVEVGTTLTTPATFTWGITVNSGVVATLDIKDVTGASTLLAGTANDGTQSGVGLGTIQLNSNGAVRTYKGTLHDTGTSPSDIDSSPFTITSRYYRFFGPTATSPTNSATVRALPSSAFQTGAGTFILNTGNTQTKFVVALPPSITITSVYDIDALGANITSSYVLTGTISVTDAGGTGRTYNIYEMNIGAAYSTSHQHSITTT